MRKLLLVTFFGLLLSGLNSYAGDHECPTLPDMPEVDMPEVKLPGDMQLPEMPKLPELPKLPDVPHIPCI